VLQAIVMREMELWRDKVQLRIRDRIQNSASFRVLPLLSLLISRRIDGAIHARVSRD